MSPRYELKPHLSKYWKIPPEGSAAFVAAMEDILEVYHLAYDPNYPVVCMDESCKQMIGEVRNRYRADRDNRCALTMNTSEMAWRKSSWKWSRWPANDM